MTLLRSPAPFSSVAWKTSDVGERECIWTASEENAQRLNANNDRGVHVLSMTGLDGVDIESKALGQVNIDVRVPILGTRSVPGSDGKVVDIPTRDRTHRKRDSSGVVQAITFFGSHALMVNSRLDSPDWAESRIDELFRVGRATLADLFELPPGSSFLEPVLTRAFISDESRETRSEVLHVEQSFGGLRVLGPAIRLTYDSDRLRIVDGRPFTKADIAPLLNMDKPQVLEYTDIVQTLIEKLEPEDTDHRLNDDLLFYDPATERLVYLVYLDATGYVVEASTGDPVRLMKPGFNSGWCPSPILVENRVTVTSADCRRSFQGQQRTGVAMTGLRDFPEGGLASWVPDGTLAELPFPEITVHQDIPVDVRHDGSSCDYRLSYGSAKDNGAYFPKARFLGAPDIYTRLTTRCDPPTGDFLEFDRSSGQFELQVAYERTVRAAEAAIDNRGGFFGFLYPGRIVRSSGQGRVIDVESSSDVKGPELVVSAFRPDRSDCRHTINDWFPARELVLFPNALLTFWLAPFAALGEITFGDPRGAPGVFHPFRNRIIICPSGGYRRWRTSIHEYGHWVHNAFAGNFGRQLLALIGNIDNPTDYLCDLIRTSEGISDAYTIATYHFLQRPFRRLNREELDFRFVEGPGGGMCRGTRRELGLIGGDAAPDRMVPRRWPCAETSVTHGTVNQLTGSRNSLLRVCDFDRHHEEGTVISQVLWQLIMNRFVVRDPVDPVGVNEIVPTRFVEVQGIPCRFENGTLTCEQQPPPRLIDEPERGEAVAERALEAFTLSMASSRGGGDSVPDFLERWLSILEVRDRDWFETNGNSWERLVRIFDEIGVQVP